jgi:hypothetical protein
MSHADGRREPPLWYYALALFPAVSGYPHQYLLEDDPLAEFRADSAEAGLKAGKMMLGLPPYRA